jgi:hypothetical protein
MLDHHHRVGAARDDAAGRDRRRRAGRHLERRLNPAGDHFGIEREAARRAVAGAGGIGGTHGETVDIGAVERRRIDRRDDIGCEHAGERRGERHGFAAKRRAIDAGFEAASRHLRRNHFEELFLPRRAPHRVEDRRAALAMFFWFFLWFYGHDLTATTVPAPNPSLSAGTTIQPSLRVSA